MLHRLALTSVPQTTRNKRRRQPSLESAPRMAGVPPTLLGLALGRARTPLLTVPTTRARHPKATGKRARGHGPVPATPQLQSLQLQQLPRARGRALAPPRPQRHLSPSRLQPERAAAPK